MNDRELEKQDWLMAKSEIVERPFSSDVPILGPLIAWIRTLWNSVATKWYVRPILDQQNEFNRLSVERIHEFETYVYELVSEQDRDLNRLKQDLASLRLQLSQLNRRLEELNNRMPDAETGRHSGEFQNDD